MSAINVKNEESLDENFDSNVTLNCKILIWWGNKQVLSKFRTGLKQVKNMFKISLEQV